MLKIESPKSPRTPRRKVSDNKEKSLSDTQRREVELIDVVRSACDICHPDTFQNGTLEFFKSANQTDFDRVCGKHKLEEHNIKDSCTLEKEFMKSLEAKYKPLPESILIDGFQRMRCTMEKCDAYFTASKPWNYYIHRDYHDQLQRLNLKYVPNYPCLHCPQSYPTYYELNDHIDDNHPRFLYKCLVRDCNYQSTKFKNRQGHFNLVHSSVFQNVVHTCQVNPYCDISLRDRGPPNRGPLS